MMNIDYKKMLEGLSREEQEDILLQLAKINLGVSCVVREFSKDYLKNNFVFELKQKNPIPERAIGYCYSKSLHLTPTMKEFMTFLDSDFAGK